MLTRPPIPRIDGQIANAPGFILEHDVFEMADGSIARPNVIASDLGKNTKVRAVALLRRSNARLRERLLGHVRRRCMRAEVAAAPDRVPAVEIIKIDFILPRDRLISGLAATSTTGERTFQIRSSNRKSLTDPIAPSLACISYPLSAEPTCNMQPCLYRHPAGQLFAPPQEQADIARLPTWEIKHLGRKIESVRSKRRVPPVVNVRRFAPKGLGPCGIRGIVDRAGVICAKLAREAQQKELLLAALRGLSRLFNQLIPGGIADLACDHRLDLLPPVYRDFPLQVFFDLNLLICEHFLKSPKRVRGWID